jgi:hypothetical protein
MRSGEGKINFPFQWQMTRMVSPDYPVGDKILSVLLPELHFRQVEGRNIVIYTDLSEKKAIHYANFFDGFYDYFSSHFFPIQQDKPLQIVLFGNPRDYRLFCKKNDTPKTPFGFYMGLESNMLVVNLDRGLGTATHVLIYHFLAASNMDHYPGWIKSGLATFFEKFMGYVDVKGDLHISFGYFSNWRFPLTKRVIRGMTLERLFREADQSIVRSFMVFLHRKGCLQEFYRQLHDSHVTRHEDLLVDACNVFSLADLETEWKNWVINQPIDANVMLVPSAFVITQPEWFSWWRAEGGERMVWDENLRMYIAR